MRRTIVVGGIFGLWLAVGSVYAQAGEPNAPCCQPQNRDPNALEAVLERLEAKADELQSFQCQIDYVFEQPLLESQARQKGMMYYAKFEDRSYLRVDFDTIQYDEEKEQKRKEQFFFDGIWATYIDYQVKSVQRQQVAEPNKPVDAFTLVSRRVPVLGFSRTQELQEQFDIELAPEDPSGPSDSFLLHMKVKPDSLYKDDYTTIAFRVDKDNGLPVQIDAVSAQKDVLETERDVHRIRLLNPKINEGIRKSRFDIQVPDSFSVETIPLERGGAPR